MRQLHPEAIASIQSKVLFSKAEELLLSKVGSVRPNSRIFKPGLFLLWNEAMQYLGIIVSSGAVLLEILMATERGGFLSFLCSLCFGLFVDLEKHIFPLLMLYQSFDHGGFFSCLP